MLFCVEWSGSPRRAELAWMKAVNGAWLSEDYIERFEKFDGSVRITSRTAHTAEIDGVTMQWHSFLVRMRVPDIPELKALRRIIDPDSVEKHLIRDFTLHTQPQPVKP